MQGGELGLPFYFGRFESIGFFGVWRNELGLGVDADGIGLIKETGRQGHGTYTFSAVSTNADYYVHLKAEAREFPELAFADNFKQTKEMTISIYGTVNAYLIVSHSKT